MTSPTLPVRLLNAVRLTPSPAPVIPQLAPAQWCWSCKRRLPDAEFGPLGTRCTDCLMTESRVRSAALALRFLRSSRPAPVRRLVAWRCLASAVTEQAALAGIDLTGCPLPEPGGHRREVVAS